jgi:hypothetical protein
MWKNTVQPARPQMTIQRDACALHAGYPRLQTHAEYVILSAFQQQQWFRKYCLVLHLYVHRLSCLLNLLVYQVNSSFQM